MMWRWSAFKGFSLIVGGAIAAAAFTLSISHWSTLLNGWDDWRWRWLTSDTGTPIYLVDIDEQSLANIGRWPWSREKMADLLTTLLDEYEVAVVGVDILFAEAGEPSGDARLATLDHDRVVWAHAASLAGEAAIRQGVLADSPTCPEGAPWEVGVQGWLGLAGTIATESTRAGHIRPWPDADRVVRRYQPFLADGRRCMPALGLALYAALLGTPSTAPLQLLEDEWRWNNIPLGLEEPGLLRLIWKPGTIRSISAQSVLEHAAALPQSAVVIIGSSAVGIGDFVVSPDNQRMTGAVVHALALRQWLDREFVLKPIFHDLVLGLALTVMFLMFWRFSSRTAIKPWLVWLSATVIWLILTSLLWQRGILLDSEPFFWALLLLPGVQGLRLWQARRASQTLYQQFQPYLPETVLTDLINSGADPRQLAAESREVSVMFADLRGFTSLSENMPPQQVVALLNTVMQYLSNHVANHAGTLDKFMGDGIMAFWGAPVDMVNHSQRAVTCAEAILNNLPELNSELKNRSLPAVRLSIGINSGQVAVGHMGSRARRAYTAIGDAVNIAARLQQATRDLNTDLLIGSETASRCPDDTLVPLQEVEIKGRKQAVQVFTSASVYRNEESAAHSNDA